MAHNNVRDRSVVRMLGCLNPAQLKDFRAYLTCHLFNTSATLVRLFDLLERLLSEAGTEPLTAEAFLQGSGIRPTLMNKLSSQLQRHLNQFVALQTRREVPGSAYPFIFRGWAQLGLDRKLLDREYDKMKKRLQEPPWEQSDLAYRLELEHLYVESQVTQPRRRQSGLFDELLMIQEQHHRLQALRYQCAAQSADRIFGAGSPSQEVTAYQAALRALESAYREAHALLQNAGFDREGADRLLQLLQRHQTEFSHADQSDLYGYLLNTCMRGVSAADPEAEALLLRVYDELLARELLLDGGQINPAHFKNIVSIKGRLGYIEEARAFIRDYTDHLPPADKDILVRYTRGLLAFYERDFRAAIGQFQSIARESSEDLFWGLEARNMLWKSYFEAYDDLTTDEYAEMMRLYDSFRQFIARKSGVSHFHKKGYANFIRLFSRAIRILEQHNFRDQLPHLETLLAEVTQAEQLPHKKWLRSAIESRIREKR
ncbi:MAG: hypothetical protein AAGN35_23320 [Bacteroidota bacterium]